MASVTFRHILRELNNGLDARVKEQTDQAMQQINVMVENYGKELRQRIKDASGREHIADDPISMSAASLDAMDNTTKKRSTNQTNPLKAALEGDIESLGNSLNEDDEDGLWI